MKRSLAWIAGLVGIAALGRFLSRRAGRSSGLDRVVAAPDPAEELRRKLDEQRGDTTTEAQPSTDAHGESLEERRARVHAKAQEAIDAMREPDA